MRDKNGNLLLASARKLRCERAYAFLEVLLGFQEPCLSCEQWRRQSDGFRISGLQVPLQAALCARQEPRRAEDAARTLRVLQGACEGCACGDAVSRAAWVLGGLCAGGFSFVQKKSEPRGLAGPEIVQKPTGALRELYGFRSPGSAVLQSQGKVFDELRDEVFQGLYFEGGDAGEKARELLVCLGLEERLRGRGRLEEICRLAPYQTGLAAEFLHRHFLESVREIAMGVLGGAGVGGVGVEKEKEFGILPAELLQKGTMLQELGRRNALLRVIFQRVDAAFRAFYQAGRPLDLESLRTQILQSYAFAPYETYKEIVLSLRAQHRSGEGLAELLTEEEHEARRRERLRDAARMVAEEHVVFSPLDEEHVEVGFAGEAREALEIRAGFCVEGEVLEEILEEMKMEVFQRLRMDEAQFLQLLKKRGGRLYDFYVNRKAADVKKEALKDDTVAAAAESAEVPQEELLPQSAVQGEEHKRGSDDLALKELEVGDAQIEEQPQEEIQQTKKPDNDDVQNEGKQRPALPIPLFVEDDQAPLLPSENASDDPIKALAASRTALEAATRTKGLVATARDKQAYGELIRGVKRDADGKLSRFARFEAPDMQAVQASPWHAAEEFLKPLEACAALKELAVWQHLRQVRGVERAVELLRGRWCMDGAGPAAPSQQPSSRVQLEPQEKQSEDAILQCLLLSADATKLQDDTRKYLERFNAILSRLKTLQCALSKGVWLRDFRYRRLCCGVFGIQTKLQSRLQAILSGLEEETNGFRQKVTGKSTDLEHFRSLFQGAISKGKDLCEPREERILNAAEFYGQEVLRFVGEALQEQGPDAEGEEPMAGAVQDERKSAQKMLELLRAAGRLRLELDKAW